MGILKAAGLAAFCLAVCLKRAIPSRRNTRAFNILEGLSACQKRRYYIIVYRDQEQAHTSIDSGRNQSLIGTVQ
jgi:hypothetical protein